jgi:2-polyprenyl-6-methoxyphenol hydroxylase-like FAD-dependent oxidoreductase
MADIVVLGGGWCGLTTALLLSRDGHAVTVLEKDPAEPPSGDPWQDWDRVGVTQFRQPHLVMPRARAILETELPDLLAALRGAGGTEYSFLSAVAPLFPPERTTSADDRFTTVTARRPVLEDVVATAAGDELDIRRGTKVEGLLVGAANGVPTVTGVRLANGERLRADLVVDASGRKPPVPDWLVELGARPPRHHRERDGFTYYSRFFRSADGSTPVARGPLSMAYGSISILTLPADSGTWSVTIFVQARDQKVKEVRAVDAFTRVVGACPLQAHWLDGEPITDVLAMSGVMDERRDYSTESGEPVVNGVLPAGDAWASTNPSLGRGLSMALMQAVRLRDTLRLALEPAPLAKEWVRITAEEFQPWYDSAVTTDADRIAEIDAIRNGRPIPEAKDPLVRLRAAAVVSQDPELFRGLFDVAGVLALPDEVLARPEVRSQLDALGPLETAASSMPGPDREQLLALIAG